jgi:cardiolipin synthase
VQLVGSRASYVYYALTQMRNLPNLITLFRLGLIPVMAWYAASGAYVIAVPVFLLAALTDLADGYIARRFKLVSRLGALLDPVADKLNMLVATLILAWQDLIPIWLAIAIVGRDIVIVLGALGFRLARGRLTIAPTRLSKLNTFIEFAVLLLVMTTAANWIENGLWMQALFLLVLVTVVASGTQYVWQWSRMALEGRRIPRNRSP